MKILCHDIIFAIFLSVNTVNSAQKELTKQKSDFLIIIDNIPDTYIAESSIHGKGLFAAKDFRKGEILTVLDGMRISEDVYRQVVCSFYDLPNYAREYFFTEWTAIAPQVLLVRPFRTKYSFINHSRTPNLEIDFQTLEVKAIRDIKKGEELTLDYRKEHLSEEYWKSHGCNYL